MPTAGYDFREIHDTYRPKLVRYLARLAGDDEAEDLCQETFTRIDKGLKDFRSESSLATWVYRIATNTFHDRLRSRSYKQAQVEDLTPAEELETLSDGSAYAALPENLEQQVIKSEMIDCIRGYIDQLPMDYRIVLLLNEVEGFKNREIADILQISLENVKIRLHRARGRLKQTLKDNCEFYLDERSEIACDRKPSCD